MITDGTDGTEKQQKPGMIRVVSAEGLGAVIELRVYGCASESGRSYL